jgi:hypothetical protein
MRRFNVWGPMEANIGEYQVLDLGVVEKAEKRMVSAFVKPYAVEDLHPAE